MRRKKNADLLIKIVKLKYQLKTYKEMVIILENVSYTLVREIYEDYKKFYEAYYIDEKNKYGSFYKIGLILGYNDEEIDKIYKFISNKE